MSFIGPFSRTFLTQLTAAQKCTIRLIMAVESLSVVVREASSAHVSVMCMSPIHCKQQFMTHKGAWQNGGKMTHSYVHISTTQGAESC